MHDDNGDDEPATPGKPMAVRPRKLVPQMALFDSSSRASENIARRSRQETPEELRLRLAKQSMGRLGPPSPTDVPKHLKDEDDEKANDSMRPDQVPVVVLDLDEAMDMLL